MTWEPYKALYIHVPFCSSRCRYCDFETEAVDPDSPEMPDYFGRLVSRIRRESRLGRLGSIETIYIGGGTPTHAGNARLTELLYALSLSIRMENVREVTVEANPGSLDPRMVNDIWALGANRISIGVQSFDDHLLATLGRAHSSAQAVEAMAIARERFDNVSVDLICGIPGQSVEDVVDSVRKAVANGAVHVSVYPLTVEPGTPLERMVDDGILELPEEDTVADMMEAAADALQELGLERYEVASFARPGYECEHNLAYWSGVPYLGLGRSAVSMAQDGSHRIRYSDGRLVERIDGDAIVAEDLMLAMRTRRGIDDATVASASESFPDILGTLQGIEGPGLIRHEDGRWAPTDRGWLLGNEIYTAMLSLCDGSVEEGARD